MAVICPGVEVRRVHATDSQAVYQILATTHERVLRVLLTGSAVGHADHGGDVGPVLAETAEGSAWVDDPEQYGDAFGMQWAENYARKCVGA